MPFPFLSARNPVFGIFGIVVLYYYSIIYIPFLYQSSIIRSSFLYPFYILTPPSLHPFSIKNPPPSPSETLRFLPITQSLFEFLRKLRLTSLPISQGVALILFKICLISEAQPHSSNSTSHLIPSFSNFLISTCPSCYDLLIC